MALYHINFHTLNNLPIFENETYDQEMRLHLRDALQKHRIVCLTWEVMPTHVHLIIADFPDLTRGAIVNCIKDGLVGCL